MHDIEHVQVEGAVIAVKHRGKVAPVTMAYAVSEAAAREVGEALACYYHVPLKDGSGFPLTVS